MKSVMDTQRVKEYWVDEAQEALKVASHLFEKQDFSYALFFGHLALEKLLKALYVVKNKEHPVYSQLAQIGRINQNSPYRRKKRTIVEDHDF